MLPSARSSPTTARRSEAELKAQGLPRRGDYRPEKIGFKIREAQLEKIPYMLVVGDKEQTAGTVAVRATGSSGDLGAMPRGPVPGPTARGDRQQIHPGYLTWNVGRGAWDMGDQKPGFSKKPGFSPRSWATRSPASPRSRASLSPFSDRKPGFSKKPGFSLPPATRSPASPRSPGLLPTPHPPRGHLYGLFANEKARRWVLSFAKEPAPEYDTKGNYFPVLPA